MRLMHRIALNVDLAASGDTPPEWPELLPAGPAVEGRDGRTWLFDDVAKASVLSLFTARNAHLPIDWEHATQLRAPKGEEAPAGGWIEGLEIRNGTLVGKTAWTARAANQITAKEYRYLSPVFDYDPATGRIVRLVSAGLTNTPNLHLRALNSEETPMNRSAALVAAITGALGLAATADDDAIATAINTVKTDRDTAQALNTERAPSLERFVPRADYDTLLARATNAENTIKDRDSAAHAAAVDAEIEAATKAGKITPATVDYHRATCSDQAGLERFRNFVKAAPTVADASTLDGRKAVDTALNAEQIAGKAREYRASQASVGNHISVTQAVDHVTKGVN